MTIYTPPYITVGSAIPEPMQGKPTEQPIRAENGNPPPRVQVHTELSIPIYFDPATGQFSAQVGPVQGKGEHAELHSPDFAVLVERIRQRALVVPVQGYLVTVDHNAETDDQMVEVRPCTVIEHHARRYQPFVVRVMEPGVRSRRDTSGTPLPPVERIRSTNAVMLPEPSHIEQVRVAQKALKLEEERHTLTQRILQRDVRDALDAIPRLTARDLTYVQESGLQVAQPQEALEGLLFDLVDDDQEGD